MVVYCECGEELPELPDKKPMFGVVHICKCGRKYIGKFRCSGKKVLYKRWVFAGYVD